MDDAEQDSTTNEGVLADIRGIADNVRTPAATRLRALELLAKLAGMFSAPRRPQQIRIIRLTPPLRLPAKGATNDDDRRN